MSVFVRGMQGLGDNIYQRAFVKALAGDVFLQTSWPELYEDLPNVRFVKPTTVLRTQSANAARQPAERWSSPPASRRIDVGYGAGLERSSIPAAMRRAFGIEPQRMDLPDCGPSPVRSEKPIALVRPVTMRTEWLNEARAPLPEYVAIAAAIVSKTHHVVSIADLKPGAEWLVGPTPKAHETFHGGELDVRALMALVAASELLIGGVGWIVPAAIAAGRRLYCILGGQGGHNAPERLTSSQMDLSRIGWAMPAKFCRCTNMRHACDKHIDGFETGLRTWLQASA